MGIKDLFGKGKKAEFREKAKEVAQGKLSPGKAAELAALSKEHDIDNPGDDKTMLRREIYNKAAGGARSRGKLTEGEAAELAKIQKFLALRDDQVEKTKWDLARLRTLTEIRQGRLPTAGSQAAAQGVRLEQGELAHYHVPVETFDRPSPGGHAGQLVKWGAQYLSHSARGHRLPVEGAREVGAGHLIVTSRRLILKGDKRSETVEFTPAANIFLYGDGLRMERPVGYTLLRFNGASDDTAEIVGELLSALMR